MDCVVGSAVLSIGSRSPEQTLVLCAAIGSTVPIADIGISNGLYIGDYSSSLRTRSNSACKATMRS